MEKYINNFKKTALITGVLSLLLFILHYNDIIKDGRGAYLTAFEFLLFVIFITSLYSFFILSDIKNNRFAILSRLNHLALVISVLFFIFGIIYDGYMYFVYIGYLLIFIFSNLIIMSIIYLIKKTAGKYFYKEWLWFLTLVLIIVLYAVIRKNFYS